MNVIITETISCRRLSWNITEGIKTKITILYAKRTFRIHNDKFMNPISTTIIILWRMVRLLLGT